MSHTERSEKIQLVALVLVFFGMLALAIPLVCSQVIPKTEVQGFQVPGKAIANFEGAGNYILYYEQFLDDEKSVQQSEEAALAQLEIEIFKNGGDRRQALKLSEASHKHLYRTGRRKGISLFSFDVAEPGEYMVQAYYRDSGKGPLLRMALGQATGNSTLIRTIILIMLGVVGFASVLTMLLFVIKIAGS